jgi:uncharacterized membrane protein
VDAFVVALVAISAVMHVTWNVRLKTAGDTLRAATIGMIAGSVAIGPVGIVAYIVAGRPPVPPEAIGLGILSGVIEAIYFVLLSAAYRRGDLSVVYPLARGTAPLLAVAIGVIVLGERLGVAGTIGVVALIAGFLLLQQPWRVRGHGLDPSIAFALATGVTIATYSAIDRVGSRLLHPLAYAAILWVTTSIALLFWLRRVGGGEALTRDPVEVRWAAIGGWLTLGAYLLILWALSLAPLSGVAPLRESATVFASAWGSVKLREAADRGDTLRRVGASLLIVGGAILLATGG